MTWLTILIRVAVPEGDLHGAIVDAANSERPDRLRVSARFGGLFPSGKDLVSIDAIIPFAADAFVPLHIVK